MAQTFHKFRAPSFEEALQQMRRSLGQDAVVVRSTHVKQGGIFGFLGQPMVELTASASPLDSTQVARRRTAIEKAYGASAVAPASPVGSDERVEQTVQFYKGLVEDAQARMGIGGEPSPRQPAGPVAPQARDQVNQFATRSTQAPQREAVVPRPVAQELRPRLNASARTVHRPVSEGNVAVDPAVSFTPLKEAVDNTQAQALQREVRDMREMLQVLVAETPGAGLPTELAPHYRRLLDSGISRKAAAMLLGAAVKGSEVRVLSDERVVTERLRLEIRNRVPTTGGLQVDRSGRKVIALVGPTGVGKTTNLAKLAAQFAVRQQAKVALLTADTYRVAAPDQLRVYANIIGLHMEVVNDPKEMKAALESLSSFHLVFVDTAGSSQFNMEQIHELEGMLDAARPDDVMLALAANTQLEDLRQIVENFKCVKPTSLLFTKLDETRRYGSLFSLALESRLPLSYLSVGQNVPDDIVLAQPAKVANLVLEGRDRRGRSSAESS